LQIVHGAIPQVYFELNSSVSAAELAVHVLDYLYKKLDEVCLVQGGEVVTSVAVYCVWYLSSCVSSSFCIQI
jgi:hypothetical protein